jgi:hypothetical protein
MNRRLMPLAMVGIAALLGACGAGQPTAPPSPTGIAAEADDPVADVAPFHAVAADSVFVSGTPRCRFSEEDGAFIAACTLDLSDPRVSGSERQAGWQVVVDEQGQSRGTVQIADTCTIANDVGSWRGGAQATDLDNTGTLLEAHYVGEGAYDGLEFHYYVSDVDSANAPPVLMGWISGGG